VAFWSAVTGFSVSEPRGEREQLATLVPPPGPDGAGDDYLRVQRIDDPVDRIHLDIHVANPQAAAAAAVEIGAQVLLRHEAGFVVLRSPGGLTFCFVPHPAGSWPAPVAWADGNRSQVDQVCLDIPPSVYDVETEFWATITGWHHDPDVSREYARLEPPHRQLRWLFQRLDDERDAVTVHLDLSADDRLAETARHVALGARVVREHPLWTVLADPLGAEYCITARTPLKG